MVDFRKKLTTQKIEKKIHPVEIYDTLDRSSNTRSLDQIQTEILKNWFDNYKTKKDVILKLHTGQGKTVVGLLILQSQINQNKGPCLYLCPNIYLAKQTCEQAKKFGIPYVTFGQGEKDLPHEFLEGKKILICHVQKLFTGITAFGLNSKSEKLSTVILDDSHACIESIKDSFTIKLPSSHKGYEAILNLFEEDLLKQRTGTLNEIKQKDYNAFMAVPYWAWQDKNQKILDILSFYKKEEEDKKKDPTYHKHIIYAWPLLKDYLLNCQCVISGSSLEISPYYNPINQFGSFSNAEHRILMSATTMNDDFFIKGLDIQIEAIKYPLIASKEKWSGEKMIIAPSLIDDSLERWQIVSDMIQLSTSKKIKGMVILTPSYKISKEYETRGCILVKHDNIEEELNKLKNGNYENPVVITNRYDGIDLPDDACRVLVIDSKPFAENLGDRYEEECRANSDVINIRIAQKIEQGFGRSVRGAKDYSVIILIGADLVNFVKGFKTKKYFSDQTKKQIDIGMEASNLANTEHEANELPSSEIIFNLIKQCAITRDDGWKAFYEEEMNKLGNHSNSKKDLIILETLEEEKKAEHYNFMEEHEKAAQTIQSIIDKYYSNKPEEKGWYLQTIARFKYPISKMESNDLQLAAYKNNIQLLKPQSGITYKKIEFIDGNRVKAIKDWLSQFTNHQDLMLEIENLFSNLNFGPEFESDKFERTLEEIGLALGFESQRPDKNNNEGPDNLWGIGKNTYILFECKNKVLDTRSEIHKDETGQMCIACAWFDRNYPNTEMKPIMIIPTKNISSAAGFNHDVEIMRKAKLNEFKKNIRNFFNEFAKFDIHALNDSQIQKAINVHKLDIDNLKTQYSEKPHQK